MTTIVYRDGVLAADGAAFAGHLRQPGNVTKVVRSPAGHLAAACGSAAFCERWNAWVQGGMAEDPPEPERDTPEHGGDCGVLVHPDGRLQAFESFGPYFVDGPYFAMGAGDAIALGAFYAGASAEVAIMAAITYDAHTGGSPTILRLGGE